MKTNQFKFYEALENAMYAYKCFRIQNKKMYTEKELEGMAEEIELLQKVLTEMKPWTSEEIIIDEMPF